MQPAAASAPVLREWSTSFAADVRADNRARVQARTHLTVLRWNGSVHDAAAVVGQLVHNAVAHGVTPTAAVQRIRLRLAVTESHELLVDVTDPSPVFRGFHAAIRGEQGCGLWEVQRLGGAISWFLKQDATGKTVRAALNAGPVSA